MNLRIVGIADLAVSNDPGETLVAQSLGACMGVAIHDPGAGVGGMLHCMLPDSALDAVRAQHRPALFADTGIPLLLDMAFRLGLNRGRTRVVVAGGARILDDSGFFDVGSRNCEAVRRILGALDLALGGEDLGGVVNRTLHLTLATGRAWVRCAGQEVREL
jgi:chemotaxis protein CheD